MPVAIQFVTGQFQEFRVAKGFHFGPLARDMALDEVFEFDGRTLKVGGETWPAEKLKGAILAGWIVLSSDVDYVPPRPQPAGVSVRPADNSVKGKAPSDMTTVGHEEREVGLLKDFTERSKAALTGAQQKATRMVAAHARAGDTAEEILGGEVAVSPRGTSKYAMSSQDDERQVRRLTPCTPQGVARAAAEAAQGGGRARTASRSSTMIEPQEGVPVRSVTSLRSKQDSTLITGTSDIQRGIREAHDTAVASTTQTVRRELTPQEYAKVLAAQKGREAAFNAAKASGMTAEQAKELLAQHARVGDDLAEIIDERPVATEAKPVLDAAYWQALMNMAFTKCGGDPDTLQKVMGIIMQWREAESADPDLEKAWAAIEDILNPPAFVPDAVYWQGLMSKAFQECSGDPAKLQKAMGLIMQWQKEGSAADPDVGMAWEIVEVAIAEPDIEVAPASSLPQGGDISEELYEEGEPVDEENHSEWDTNLQYAKRIKLALEKFGNDQKALTHIISVETRDGNGSKSSAAVVEALRKRLQELLTSDVVMTPAVS